MIRRIIGLGIGVAFWAWSRFLEALRGEADECVILYYHGVSDGQLPRFRRQMRWLAGHARVVGLLAAADRAKGRRVCLTFDDGLDSVRRNALGVLRELRLPATVFVVSGNLGDTPRWPMPCDHPERHERLSRAEELREYPADLVDIGSHTVTHRSLRELSDAEVRRELVDSKRELEEAMGRPVRSFSAPFGEFRDSVFGMAADAGYDAVVTCEPRTVRSGDGLIGAGRFKVTPDDWSVEFRLKAAGAYRWRYFWRALRSRNRRVDFAEATAANPMTSEGVTRP